MSEYDTNRIDGVMRLTRAVFWNGAELNAGDSAITAPFELQRHRLSANHEIVRLIPRGTADWVDFPIGQFTDIEYAVHS